MSRLAARLLLGAEAAAALCAASLAVKLLPSARTRRLLGVATSAVPAGVNRARVEEAKRVGRAVRRVADVLPWHPVCLPQALAARAMLRRRGIRPEVHLGVAGVSPLEAHAWVSVDGAVVLGGGVPVVGRLATFR